MRRYNNNNTSNGSSTRCNSLLLCLFLRANFSTAWCIGDGRHGLWHRLVFDLWILLFNSLSINTCTHTHTVEQSDSVACDRDRESKTVRWTREIIETRTHELRQILAKRADKCTHTHTHTERAQPCVRICEFHVNNANCAKQQITFPIRTTTATSQWLVSDEKLSSSCDKKKIKSEKKRASKQTNYSARPINRPHFQVYLFIYLKGRVLNSLAPLCVLP